MREQTAELTPVRVSGLKELQQCLSAAGSSEKKQAEEYVKVVATFIHGISMCMYFL